MGVYKHVMYATDFTKASQLAAKKALQFAKAFNAKLSIIHIIDEIPAYVYTYMGSVDIETKLFSEAKKKLAGIGRRLEVLPSRRYVQSGAVKKELLTAVENYQVDLLILGSHSKTGLSSLLGSTASGLSNSAPCDVVVVHEN